MEEPTIHFRFHRPKEQRCPPSFPMVEALRQISLSDEIQPLLGRARADGREVLIEIFHSKGGEPMLIHIAMFPQVNS
jgi:hypothetical protein